MLGDLYSLQGQLDEANIAYDSALLLAEDDEQRDNISCRFHRRSFVTRAGHKIAYYEHGTKGELLVIFNPTGYYPAVAQPSIERLAQEFRVVTISPLGEGASDPLTADYPFREKIKDMQSIVEALGDEEIVGIGISLGCTIAATLYQRFPTRFQKLIFVGAAPGDPQSPYNGNIGKISMAELLSYKDDGYREIVTTFVANLITEPEAQGVAQTFREAALAMPREAFANLWRPDPEKKLLPQIGNIKVPLLITHGTEDGVIPFAFSEYLKSIMPDASFYAFDAIGHQPMFTAADRFSEVVKQFVKTGKIAI